MIILGIDPGSRITGYGVIETAGSSKHNYIASGCIHATVDDIGQRLLMIFDGLTDIMENYQPEEVAIEQVFVHQNVNTALKLGQARGAAIVSAAGKPVAEYSARQVKQSIVGYGAADKEQIQQMVKVLLHLSDVPQVDAADALAIALCHAQLRSNPMGAAASKPRGIFRRRWR